MLLFNDLSSNKPIVKLKKKSKMKAESTIKKQMQKLREFILDNNDSKNPEIKHLVLRAYCMETTLLWVTTNYSWNPINNCQDSLKYILEKQNE